MGGKKCYICCHIRTLNRLFGCQERRKGNGGAPETWQTRQAPTHQEPPYPGGFSEPFPSPGRARGRGEGPCPASGAPRSSLTCVQTWGLLFVRARARRVIPGCRWGFAGRAAGSWEQQQPSGFAQHNDKPCAHFLHRRSQRHRRTFQAGPSGSARPPGLTGEVELQFGCGDRRLRNLLGTAKIIIQKKKSLFFPTGGSMLHVPSPAVISPSVICEHRALYHPEVFRRG